MMNKIKILMLLCLLAVTAASAQEYKGKMRVTPLQLEQQGDSLMICIDFDISGVSVDSRRSVSLIPTLIADSIEKRLPEVMVKGRANYLTSKREVALMSRTERLLYDKSAPYAIVKGYKSDEQKRVLYRKTILFEPWMKEARMDIREDLCGCGNPPRSLAVSQLINKVQLQQAILPYEPTPHLAYVQPTIAVKKRELTGEAFLDFVVSKTDIRPGYMNNPRELKKITDMVEEVRNDPAITVNSISVVGYASPEGTLKFNQYLSRGRANALIAYLLPRFDYPRDMYRVTFGGENWEGLHRVVEEMDWQHKDEVLHILENVSADTDVNRSISRKKSLKGLKDGEPYRYLLKEVFPSLRKAICKIEYEVKGFDIVEAKEVFKTHPQNLSLNEMFMVANTYEEGSQQFIDVLDTAVRLFPYDDTANLNAAAAALARKDTATAERYLSKVKTPSAQYYNAMGVLRMLVGQYEAARELFVKAEQQGLVEATKNLEEMETHLRS